MGFSYAATNRGSGKSGNNGGYLNASNNMQTLLENKNDILHDAGRQMGAYAKQKNDAGESNLNSLRKEIAGLLAGFSVEEQVTILTDALATAIINI